MAEEMLYEKALQRYLSDELKVVNAHLPRQRKPLSELLDEEYPQVICSDGGVQSFKRKELAYLTGLLNEEECRGLLLPMLIEVLPDQGEAIVLSHEGVEGKVISHILEMPLVRTERGIRIYRPQLSAVRQVLRTTTQYVFSAQIT
ncbi:MAG: hypothetical protein DDT30_01745 [Dehalococcoidia bacterium]|nr:hypothetical protein [Bacillota bacterium]MBT9143767.1 hypothetical protein [Bacillota bacterium]